MLGLGPESWTRYSNSSDSTWTRYSNSSDSSNESSDKSYQREFSLSNNKSQDAYFDEDNRLNDFDTDIDDDNCITHQPYNYISPDAPPNEISKLETIKQSSKESDDWTLIWVQYNPLMHPIPPLLSTSRFSLHLKDGPPPPPPLQPGSWVQIWARVLFF